MTNAPARRGRRPTIKAVTKPEETQDAPVTAPARRRRGTVGGHSLRLQAPSRDGYTRRWVNDDGNRIADAEELAYDFVSEPLAKSSDAGSRVSRLVGTKANGEPLRAYLMETPHELYADGLAEKEALNRTVDEAIASGSPVDGQGLRDLVPDQGSIQRDR